jgi:hypothetical protein
MRRVFYFLFLKLFQILRQFQDPLGLLEVEQKSFDVFDGKLK